MKDDREYKNATENIITSRFTMIGIVIRLMSFQFKIEHLTTTLR